MVKHWRINDYIAAILLAITALAPLPMGSNRPMFWMLSASIIFATAGIFLLGMALKSRKFPVPLGRLWLPLVLGAAYVVFMGLQAMGLLPSTTPNASLLATLRTLSYGAFFFMLLQVTRNQRRAGWMLEALFYTVAVYALIGFLARFNIVALPDALLLSDAQSGARATFVNRNSFATFLGFGLLMGVALISQRVGTLRSRLVFSDTRFALYLVALLIIAATLVSTNSRMGVAAVLVALGAYGGIVGGKRGNIGLLAAVSGASIFALFVGAAFYLYGESLLDRLGTVERDADVRLALYRQVWDMILARPWAGFGADSFEIAFQQFHKPPVSADLIWDKAHNTYLTNWAETGFIFGSIPVVLLALAFCALSRSVYHRSRGFGLPLLGLSVIVQGAVHSLADFSLEIQANVFLFLAIVAISLANTVSGRGGK